MAHMIAGFPSERESLEVAKGLVAGGADIIELQIPFSDPMADGPTIATSCEEALAKGMTVAKSLSLVKKISRFAPSIAVMTYVNPVYRYGIEAFVKTIAQNGASALIVPDCPFDTQEGQALLTACKKHNVYLIPVVSPCVPTRRLKMIAKDSAGFVYCTSRQGITGAHSTFAKSLFGFVMELKRIFELPIAVGFGIQSKADVQAVERHAEIIVAGSVFVAVAKTRPRAIASAMEKKVRELISK